MITKLISGRYFIPSGERMELHLGLICGESADAVVGHGVQNIAHVRGYVHLFLVAAQDERMLQQFVVLGP